MIEQIFVDGICWLPPYILLDRPTDRDNDNGGEYNQIFFSPFITNKSGSKLLDYV